MTGREEALKSVLLWTIGVYFTVFVCNSQLYSYLEEFSWLCSLLATFEWGMTFIFHHLADAFIPNGSKMKKSAANLSYSSQRY